MVQQKSNEKKALEGDSRKLEGNDRASCKVNKHNLSEMGAAMVEYALLVALVAVGSIGAVTALGENADTSFQTVVGIGFTN